MGYIVIVTALRGGAAHSSSLVFEVFPFLATDNKSQALIGVLVIFGVTVVLFFVLAIIASVYTLL